MRRPICGYWLSILREPASPGMLFPVHHCFLIFLVGGRVRGECDYGGHKIGGWVVKGGCKWGWFR